MPSLDRLITLQVTAEGHRETMGDAAGRLVDGPVTFDGQVWAEIREVRTSYDLERDGIRVTGDLDFIIQWRSDVWTSRPELNYWKSLTNTVLCSTLRN